MLERIERIQHTASMARLVQKFGGTSVADVDKIRAVADRVRRDIENGHQVAVVVSAMAGVTDQLVRWVYNIARFPDLAEHDQVVATGEQVTCALVALALQEFGVQARSFTGWQVPIQTDTAYSRARIQKIDGAPLLNLMQRGTVPVLAGFQGVSPEGRVSTLGRGGSDTSAVALAIALQADRCDICKDDVDGIYSADPRLVPQARKLAKISFEEMLELSGVGSKVLQVRSVAMAMRHNLRLQVLSTFQDILGTFVVGEKEIMEYDDITGIAHSKDEAKITLSAVPADATVIAQIFGILSAAGIIVDIITHNVAVDTDKTNLTFSLSKSDLDRAEKLLREAQRDIGFSEITSDKNVVKITVVGIGMRTQAGVAHRVFATLAEHRVRLLAVSTSEIKMSILIHPEHLEAIVRSLHSNFGLDKTA